MLSKCNSVKYFNNFQEIVPWRKSRTILYWRLRRRLLEDRVIKALMAVQPELALGQGEAMLRRWFIEDKGASEVRYFRKKVYVSYWYFIPGI